MNSRRKSRFHPALPFDRQNSDGSDGFDPDLAQQQQLPALLRPLVQAHGAKAVLETGLEVLGFPATWVTSGVEVAALRKALSQAGK